MISTVRRLLGLPTPMPEDHDRRLREDIPFDGELVITKARGGFWRRECSGCGYATINGRPAAAAPPSSVSDALYEQWAFGDDSAEVDAQFTSLRTYYTWDGHEEVWVHHTVEWCPECGAVLEPQRGWRGGSDE